jgi:hypothetical protein
MDVRNKPLDRCPVDQFGDPLKPRIAPEPGRQQRIDEAHLIHPTHPPQPSESQIGKPVSRFAEVSRAG